MFFHCVSAIGSPLLKEHHARPPVPLFYSIAGPQQVLIRFIAEKAVRGAGGPIGVDGRVFVRRALA
jgi:hypothetical protein